MEDPQVAALTNSDGEIERQFRIALWGHLAPAILCGLLAFTGFFLVVALVLVAAQISVIAVYIGLGGGDWRRRWLLGGAFAGAPLLTGAAVVLCTAAAHGNISILPAGLVISSVVLLTPLAATAAVVSLARRFTGALGANVAPPTRLKFTIRGMLIATGWFAVICAVGRLIEIDLRDVPTMALLLTWSTSVCTLNALGAALTAFGSKIQTRQLGNAIAPWGCCVLQLGFFLTSSLWSRSAFGLGLCFGLIFAFLSLLAWSVTYLTLQPFRRLGFRLKRRF